MTDELRAPGTRGRNELATGHEVTLPLELRARIAGAAFSAPLAQLDGLLPDGLSPLRLTPRRGAVTLLAVDYERVGDDAMEPYDELSVQIPAAPSGAWRVPVATGWLRVVSGYVWYMPVSTEPARALGDLWCLPKEVADVAVEHDDGTTTLSVDVGGEHLLELAVARPRTVPLRLGGYVLSTCGDDRGTDASRSGSGTLVRARTSIRGDVGLWPRPADTSLSLGEHGRARTLASLDLGDGPLAAFAADCSFALGPGEPV